MNQGPFYWNTIKLDKIYFSMFLNPFVVIMSCIAIHFSFCFFFFMQLFWDARTFVQRPLDSHSLTVNTIISIRCGISWNIHKRLFEVTQTIIYSILLLVVFTIFFSLVKLPRLYNFKKVMDYFHYSSDCKRPVLAVALCLLKMLLWTWPRGYNV